MGKKQSTNNDRIKNEKKSRQVLPLDKAKIPDTSVLGENPGNPEDPRIIGAIDLILKLAGGNLQAREAPTGRNDGIDGIIIGLNMLAEELSHRVILLSEAEKRLADIMETIIAIASLDYSKRIPISDKGDTFDAIATGLNTLAEELYASTVSKDYLENIIRAMSDILLVLTPDGIIQKVNRSAVDLLGCREAELIGRPLAIIFDQEAFKELDFDRQIAKGPIKMIETIFRAKDERKFTVLFSSSIMMTEGRKVEGIVCLAHDITERKMLEQERLIRQERLAQLGQLAGGIGHELRNPLGAIKNSVYFLDMALTEKDPEIRETLDILGKEVVTSERIITSLLDFARARPPIKRKVKINEIIRETISRIHIPANIELKDRLIESSPLIMADPYQLDQVFGNIILNAVQAMPDGGSLTIKSEIKEPNCLAILFSDRGPGIPPENLQRIFAPLFTSKAKGIGLGLAICKTFIEAHEGAIEAQSELGRGATFTVRLPILKQEEKEAKDKKEEK